MFRTHVFMEEKFMHFFRESISEYSYKHAYEITTFVGADKYNTDSDIQITFWYM